MEYSPKKMNDILEQNNFNFKKKFGQNFIVDENIINSIVTKSAIDKETLVIEIGPGAGSLTAKLAESSKQVLCYEIDTTLKEILNSYGSNTRSNSSEDDSNRILFTAFINGDENYMMDSINHSKKSPKEYDLLIKSRNRNMVDEIEKNISNNKKLAVAVGALHYFGEDGIVSQLQDRGYTVEKIKTT